MSDALPWQVAVAVEPVLLDDWRWKIHARRGTEAVALIGPRFPTQDSAWAALSVWPGDSKYPGLEDVVRAKAKEMDLGRFRGLGGGTKR
jgi:hypothetical protein